MPTSPDEESISVKQQIINFRLTIVKNLKTSLKKRGKMTEMYNSAAVALGLGTTSVKNLMRNDGWHREISGIEILLLENSPLGIDRDEILGWRSAKRLNRNILRSFDDLMSNDTDVTDELKRTLREFKNKIDKLDDHKKIDLCIYITQKLIEFN